MGVQGSSDISIDGTDKGLIGGIATGVCALVLALAIAVSEHASWRALFLIINLWVIAAPIGLYLGYRLAKIIIGDLSRY